MSSAEDVVATVVVWSALTNSKGNKVQQVEQIAAGRPQREPRLLRRT